MDRLLVMKWTWLSLRNPLACSGIVPHAASWWGRPAPPGPASTARFNKPVEISAADGRESSTGAAATGGQEWQRVEKNAGRMRVLTEGSAQGARQAHRLGTCVDLR
ncbi:hypothetical protein [Burkholderia gladioli]|uniref:hypothetical protein n=1 Tax=Burkholderia gladioli TaxID=28095 RepID=UPI002FE2524D